MDELLTTRQVQTLLKVDRITVYRMLNDGRIKGVKIGNQWRFARAEINRLLGESTPSVQTESPQRIQARDFPADCVERLQDVFAGILGVGAITVNLDGDALTAPHFSNAFCRLMLSNETSRKACQESWRRIALRTTGKPAFDVCHAGLCYLRSGVEMEGKTVAWMVTGQFSISAQTIDKIKKNAHDLGKVYQIDAEKLNAAADEIPVLKHQQQLQVQEWAPKVAGTVRSMLCERIDLVKRLEKIAEISSVLPTLKNNSLDKGA